MNFWTRLLRGFSYFYHLLLGLIMLALGLVTAFSGYPLRMDQAPWTGKDLAYGLIILGAFGLFAVMLSFRGVMHWMFCLYALAMFVLLARGYFFGRYYFDTVAEFQFALILTAGALLAVTGAYKTWRANPMD